MMVPFRNFAAWNSQFDSHLFACPWIRSSTRKLTLFTDGARIHRWCMDSFSFKFLIVHGNMFSVLVYTDLYLKVMFYTCLNVTYYLFLFHIHGCSRLLRLKHHLLLVI